MAVLIVQPRYPNDPLPEVVDDFVAEIAAGFPEHSIEVTREEPWAHQVSAWEILTVWLPAGLGVVDAGKYILKFGEWLKKRKAQTGGKRVPSISIYGPDGRAIKSISVNRDSNEILVEEADPRDPLRIPPKR